MFVLDIKPGCHSAACDQPKCPENYFCYDKWRASECLRRRCTDRPCLNQATCIDYVANDIAKYRCKCREGFNGSRCETGGAMIRPSAHQEVINVKLVVGKCSPHFAGGSLIFRAVKLKYMSDQTENNDLENFKITRTY